MAHRKEEQPVTCDVTILIPCRNEIRHIDACLQSVVSQRDLTKGSEVLVIDGDSDDGTAARVERWSRKDARIRLLANPRRQVAPGLNIGIADARNDVILRMDAHTEYADDYVSACVRVLEETGADNVGGPARTRASGYVAEAIALAYHSPLVVGGSKFHDVDYEGEVDTVTYGCWHRSTLVELGGFDEELVRNQDDELNFRIQKRGGVVWQSPRIRSWYSPRSTFTAVAKQYLQYGFWKVRVIRKHGQPASVRHIVPGAFVASLAASATAAPFSVVGRYLFLSLAAIYLAFVAVTTVVIVARDRRIRFLPVLPLAVMSFQLPYGAGFLLGTINSFRKDRESASMSDLTR